MITSARGLTSAEVAERVAQGRVNRVRRSDAAEYLDIVQRNVLTLFNALVVPAAVALFLLGKLKEGFAVSGMMLANTLIGLAQEIRAKRQLDKLTLLAESKVRAVRDGAAVEVAAGDVVEGDLLLLAAGDPVVADGPVAESRFLEVDEALLTGESDPVARKVGDDLLSGSFCVAGEGVYIARRVGAAAFAQKTASEARSYSYTSSPLQAQIDKLVRLLTAVAVVMSLGYVALHLARPDAVGWGEAVSMIAATITSMVPQGLVLMATIALLLGAVAMTRRGVVVNRLGAVEAMAGIDTLCMDKTGTLTTNQLKLAAVRPVGGTDEGRVKRLLSLFAHVSLDRESKSLVAVRAKLPGEKGELLDQLPFKSQNRYSAVRARWDGGEVSLALGAFEALKPLLVEGEAAEAAWKELFATGWRLLLFCEVESANGTFAGSLEGCRLRPLAVVALSDELRPEAAEVLGAFAAQGIDFKILSGDNPETVRATVTPLGKGSDSPALANLASTPVVSGAELEQAGDPTELIRSRSVFGRVSPWQKVQVVRALTAAGHKVAMIGDGVNDVLPIKNAALGIAMGDGSRASKTVAGVVLQTNDFALLPELLDEGRIIIRNLRRAGKLFLNKNVYFLLLVVALLLMEMPFPIRSQQVTLLNFLTIGAPALLITFDRRRAPASRGDFVGEVGWFALWSGLVTACAGLLVALAFRGDPEVSQRTMVVTTLVLLGWVTLLRVAGEDVRLRLVSAAGLAVYLMAMYVPWMSWFFELEPLGAARWAWVAGVVGVAAALMWASDKLRGAPS
jgi:cation-transporting ATPase E